MLFFDLFTEEEKKKKKTKKAEVTFSLYIHPFISFVYIV